MRSAVNSCFVTYILPSSGQILAIYYTLYGLCKIIPLDGGTYVTKKQLISGFTFLLLSRYLLRTLFLFMYLCDYMYINLIFFIYSACLLFRSQILVSANYFNQILLVPLYLNMAQIC